MPARSTLLAAAAVAAGSSSLFFANASPVPALRQQTCYSGVYMIVARGSEEAPGEGKPGAVADLVQNALPDSASVAVDYPASITDPTYPTSVTDGIDNAIQLVQAYVNACGDASKIALIGFSQGGNVMTDMLAGGVDKPDPLDASYAQYITAVTVFGDPTYTTGQSFDVGNSTKDGTFSRGGDSLALLNTYASVIQSYCMEHDTFCASGDSLSTHSAEVPTFEDAASQFIINMNS